MTNSEEILASGLFMKGVQEEANPETVMEDYGGSVPCLIGIRKRADYRPLSLLAAKKASAPAGIVMTRLSPLQEL